MTDTIGDKSKKNAVRERALALGFDAVGFAPAQLNEHARNGLTEFLANGYHGDMGWMAERVSLRCSPDALWKDARSVVVVGVNYGPDRDPLLILDKKSQGAISIYAQGRDYHNVLKKKLRLLARYIAETFDEQVKLFVDTAPVLEKPLAETAGVGWQGKHSNLVSRKWGSWLFLGEIYTTLKLSPDNPEADHCGNCSRCLSVCPTNAFPAPYKLDARRCISYLTIEHKGHIPREFRTAIGNRIYGCDDCLAVCPWNKFASPTNHAELAPRMGLTAPRLRNLANLDDQNFRNLFSRSAIKRLGRERFVRNVLIAIGNSGDKTFIPTLLHRLSDKSSLIRAMAVWALSELMSEVEFSQLKDTQADKENDPDVQHEWSVNDPECC